MARMRWQHNEFRLVTQHQPNCAACAVVRSGKKAIVWMTPEFDYPELFYVCADPLCRARLVVMDVRSIRLPKL